MMKRIALIFVTCLLAGVAVAQTFELQDPAQEIFDDLENDAKKKPPPEGDAVDTYDGGDTFNAWASTDLGNTACSEFVTYRQDLSVWYWSSLYWLQGFINGAGYQQARVLGSSRLSGDLDRESMALWIETWCIENPAASLGHAAKEFVEENSGRE
jgi:hypothetical protein